ncbi:unnamed protein product [Brugia timori]|uniref:Uncharacterized protein n=1 Tax=Brugia timori TaxID=42155 RepID=A0A3P7TUJ5_9BILA|nr:unnamed protein product [Brugia timori]
MCGMRITVYTSFHLSNECPIFGMFGYGIETIQRSNITMPARCTFLLLTAFTLVTSNVLERRIIAPCPTGSRPMFRPDGQPRKCLPHQNSLCVNALPDQPDAATVCCWHNQVDYFCCLDVDYFCCLDVTPLDCPDYHNVTVVVHNAYPQNPFALRSFHFREGIEDEIVAMTQELIHDNKVRKENGVLIRRNIA